MQNFIKSFIALIAGITLMQADAIQAEPVMIDLGQIAIEQADVQFYLNGESSGYLLANCVGCPESDRVRLQIDSESKATINHQPAAFSQLAGRNDYTDVIYDPENLRLVSINILTD